MTGEINYAAKSTDGSNVSAGGDQKALMAQVERMGGIGGEFAAGGADGVNVLQSQSMWQKKDFPDLKKTGDGGGLSGSVTIDGENVFSGKMVRDVGGDTNVTVKTNSGEGQLTIQKLPLQNQDSGKGYLQSIVGQFHLVEPQSKERRLGLVRELDSALSDQNHYASLKLASVAAFGASLALEAYAKPLALGLMAGSCVGVGYGSYEQGMAARRGEGIVSRMSHNDAARFGKFQQETGHAQDITTGGYFPAGIYSALSYVPALKDFYRPAALFGMSAFGAANDGYQTLYKQPQTYNNFRQEAESWKRTLR